MFMPDNTLHRLAPVAILLALAAPLPADVIVMRDGKRVEGEVTQTEDGYAVKTRYGSLTVPKSEVLKIVPPPANIIAAAEVSLRTGRMFIEEARTATDPKERGRKLEAASALLDQALRACRDGKEAYPGDEGREFEKIAATLQQESRTVQGQLAAEAPSTIDSPAPPPATVKPAAAKPAAAVPATLPPAAPAARRPEPDAEALKAAEKLVRDTYKADYARRTPADQQAFAARLLTEAAETKDDPAGRYVLLRESRDIAAQAGDATTALSAIDRLAEAFAVDPLPMKAAALAAVARTARTPEALEALTGACLAAADEAADAEQYETALALLSRAESSARQARNTAAASRALSRRKEIEPIRAEHLKIADSLKTLLSNPDDPAANLAVGIFRCLFREDWERGLPMLAKGSDPALKALADREIARPETADQQVALGDAWWDAASQKSGPARTGCLARAAHWYEQALPKLEGIAKIKADKRIQEWEKLQQPGGGPGPAVDLLAWIDPAEHSVPPKSRWILRGRTLVSAENLGDLRFTRLLIPCIPPAEYDLAVTVSCAKPGGPFGVGLLAQGKHFVIALDPAGGITASLFGGKSSQELAASHPGDKVAWKGMPFAGDKPAALVCSVRRSSLRVTLNGQAVIEWRSPPYATASTPDEWAAPNPQCVYLVARDAATFEVSQITMKGLGGTPRKYSAPGR
jgi:hypothetical protein